MRPRAAALSGARPFAGGTPCLRPAACGLRSGLRVVVRVSCVCAALQPLLLPPPPPPPPEPQKLSQRRPSSVPAPRPLPQTPGSPQGRAPPSPPPHARARWPPAGRPLPPVHRPPPATAHRPPLYINSAVARPPSSTALCLLCSSTFAQRPAHAHTPRSSLDTPPFLARLVDMASGDVSRVEAPVTVRGYFLCAFAAFGGILFGYDSGYISGVLDMDFFKYQFGTIGSTDSTAYVDSSGNKYMYSTSQKSTITSILSAGTFFGAIFAGALADWIGRRSTIILGCGVFSVGVALQVASTTVGLLVGGRLVAGLGVGFVSAIIILYMSEIAPKAVRGAIVSGYQFAITIGILLASCVDYATQNRFDTGSYRIPMSIQFLWAIILAVGLFLLPESPRWYVKYGKLDQATNALSRLRGQPPDSSYIQDELNELVANYEYEMHNMQGAWLDVFRGGWTPSSNLRRAVVGMAMQMMQQWSEFSPLLSFWDGRNGAE